MISPAYTQLHHRVETQYDRQASDPSRAAPGLPSVQAQESEMRFCEFLAPLKRSSSARMQVRPSCSPCLRVQARANQDRNGQTTAPVRPACSYPEFNTTIGLKNSRYKNTRSLLIEENVGARKERDAVRHSDIEGVTTIGIRAANLKHGRSTGMLFG